MGLLVGDPESVAGYRLEDRLGAGGMGVVYRARSDSGRVVALKVIRGDLADSPEFRARFELEVAAARMVHSSFTVPVVDADPYAPIPWMATAYIAGPSLARQVRDHGPLGLRELRELGAGLATALRDIHRTGLVHRDLKPGNVLLEDGRPRVIDFGISRAMDGIPLTRSAHPVGTPAYMAPEQVRTPMQAGPAADVFTLGCVLVFAATGRSPFEADSPWVAAYRAAHEEPDLDGVPEVLMPLLRRLLTKDAILRPTPQEVISLLAEPAPARPRSAQGTWLGATQRIPRLRRQSRPVSRAAVAVFLAAASFLAGQWSPTVLASTPRHTGIAHRAAAGGTGQAQEQPALSPTGDASQWRCLPTPTAVFCAGAGDRAPTVPQTSVQRFDAAGEHPQWTTYTAKSDALPLHILGIAQGLVIVATGSAKSLFALDARTGVRRWRTGLIRGSAEAHFTPSTVYLADPRELTAVDTASGHIRWHRPRTTAGAHFTADGVLYETVRNPDDRETNVYQIQKYDGSRKNLVSYPGVLQFQSATPGHVNFLASPPNGARLGMSVLEVDTATRSLRSVRLPQPDHTYTPGDITISGSEVYLADGSHIT